MEAARAEFQAQVEESQQTLTNMRNRVASLELELSATQEHVDALNREKTWAEERMTKFEQQNKEYLAHIKALSENNEAVRQAQGTTEDITRLH